MTRSDQIGRTGVWFVLFAGAIYLGNFAIVQVYQTQTRLPVPEWVLGFDLLVLVPVVYLLLKRPPPARALLATFALVSIGVLAGSVILPAADKQAWRVLEDLRWIYLGALVLVQLVLLASVGREIARHWRAPNLELAIAGVLRKRVPEPTIAGLLLADARLWLYALVRDRGRFAWTAPAFHCARHDGNAGNQQAYLVLLAIEMPVMHLVLHLFSPLAAIVVTALSVYGWLFLYAEYRATLLRGSTLEADHLHIRHGVLGDLQVPYDAIATVSRVAVRPRRQRASLRFVGAGSANLRIDLRPGTRLQTLTGPRPLESLYLGLDEPAVFCELLTAAIAARDGMGGRAAGATE